MKLLPEMGNKEIGQYRCKEVEVSEDITEEEIMKLKQEFVNEQCQVKELTSVQR